MLLTLRLHRSDRHSQLPLYKFSRNCAYVTSYVGPVQMDPDAQAGAVFQVDTATLQITGKCTVGYQPDELEIMGEYIYVANSGGYRAPNYDRTISVVERYGMKQVQKIPVGIISTAPRR